MTDDAIAKPRCDAKFCQIGGKGRIFRHIELKTGESGGGGEPAGEMPRVLHHTGVGHGRHWSTLPSGYRHDHVYKERG